jgi:hypothetical protein
MKLWLRQVATGPAFIIQRPALQPCPTTSPNQSWGNSRALGKTITIELMGRKTTSKKIHLSGMEHFRWQRSYHDRIIRNSTEYTRIYNYIENNPLNYDSGKSGL